MVTRWERFKQAFARFWRRHFVPHYLIIGYYIKKPMGCTYGKRGMSEVLEEEPRATFKRIPLKQCPICQKVRMEDVHKPKGS